MYRRPKFLEILLEIRRQMALEADYDTDLFAEMARTGKGAFAAEDRETKERSSPLPVAIPHARTQKHR